MAKKNYYAVRTGKTSGIYLTWEECKNQVHGFPNASYKGFATLEEAQEYMGMPADGGQPVKAAETAETTETAEMTETAQEEHPVMPAGTAAAYVDGSFNAETGEYSCGVVFITEREEIHLARKGENEELAAMHNVAGEILGAETAMEKARELGIQKLSIYHDYEGIASWCLGTWKTNKEGTRAYKAYFDSIRDKMEIEFVKVKGHSGDKYNDLADELAKSVIFKSS